jgi:peptidoglycan/LPS O-acetylase OafA/YrhL
MGFLRITLALLVVYYHAGGFATPGVLPDGLTAVQLFYVISGFYMALVLNEKYRTPAMNWTFYSNRFFRLWPSMMVVAALTVATFVVLDRVLLYHLEMGLGPFLDTLRALPARAIALIAIANIAVFGQDWIWFLGLDPAGISWSATQLDPARNGASFLINHPTFTVAIEASFYLISPFVVRRSTALAIALAAAGFAYHIAIYLAGLDRYMWSYHFVASGAYFYFLGVCAYKAYAWLERQPAEAPLARLLARLEPAILAAAAVAILLAWNLVRAPSLSMALILAAVLPLLFRRTRRAALDRRVGELSYSVYLVHFPLYLVLLATVGGRAVLPLTIALALALACLLYLTIEAPIDRWRQRRAALALQVGRSRSGSTHPAGAPAE